LQKEAPFFALGFSTQVESRKALHSDFLFDIQNQVDREHGQAVSLRLEIFQVLFHISLLRIHLLA
jgi:hypothetical protein